MNRRHATVVLFALFVGAAVLVGALFLGVLLVIDVFGYSPIQGAVIVSAIPVAALLARPLASRLPVVLAVGSGAGLLAAGLVGLALLPSSALGYVLASLAFCGVGLGLSVPGLTHSVLGGKGGVGRKATLTVGMRHVGLVLALAVVAPILSTDLTAASDVATLNATAVIIDGQIPASTKVPLAIDIRDALERAPEAEIPDLTEAADVATLNATAVIIEGEIPASTKVPLAIDIRDALERVPEGEIPDLTAPFEEHGASSDAAVRRVRDDLVASIEEAVTRGFRRAFAFCALLAALALVPVLAFRRRLVV